MAFQGQLSRTVASWLNTGNSINNQITLCVFNSVQPVLFFFFFTGLARGTRNGEPFLPSCVLEISPPKNRARFFGYAG